MDSNTLDWLNLALRWAHLIAGISWIGNSFYFMWLDSALAKPEPPNEKVEGSLWMVHSGGFYQVERRKIYPGEMPKVLHWFKWEATFTWVTGFFLFALIYYLSGGLYLLHPELSRWSAGEAVAISFGLLVVSWFFYDLLMASPLGRRRGVADGILLLTLAGVAYWLTQNFSGRAAFIQIGAIFGTMMVANVWVRILPAQSKMIAATDRGETPNYDLSKAAKARSVHNSYLTLPVLFMMLSNHYPSLYGHAHSWVMILLLCVLGAGVRHVMIRGRDGWAGGALALIALVTMFIMTGRPKAPAPIEPPQSETAGVVPTGDEFLQVQQIMRARCVSCHAQNPQDRTFGSPPDGIYFDNPKVIEKYAERIYVRAVETKTMPLANKTGITEAERDVLGRWALKKRGGL